MRRPEAEPRIYAAEIGRLIRFVDRPELTSELGMDPALLDEREAKVPIGVWYDLIEAATAATGDPFLGLHFGIQSHVAFRADAGVMRLLILSSDTLRVAADRSLRYQSYWNEAESYEIDERDGRYSIRYELWGATRPAHVQLAEKMVAQAVSAVRTVVRDCVPEDVRFVHAPRAGGEEVARVLGREPSYGARYNEVTFPSSAFDTKLPTADAVLFRVLDRQLAERILKVSPASSFADRARKAIAEYLHREELSIDIVARLLTTSERSLQRHLTNERTSFRELVDEVRRARAIALLDLGATVSELSLLLGYSEETAFYRAFRRWTGATPETWRTLPHRDRPASAGA